MTTEPTATPSETGTLIQREHNAAQVSAIQKTTGGKLAIRQRQKRALELRLTGLTYQAIADELGCSKHGAYRAVERALKEVTREPAEAVRELELRRLDEMLATLWPAMRKGDIQALAGCLKIAERRAKLLGLDAPESALVSGQAIEVVIGVDGDKI